MDDLGPDFVPFPKIPRLNRGMVITEKIDGTNGCIVVNEDGTIHVQSRSRYITPNSDNFGFGRWVWENAPELAKILGPGHHFGEWWGSGIQRNYGLPSGQKKFSLFNEHRWGGEYEISPFSMVPGLGVVPLLYKGPFDTAVVSSTLTLLRATGSKAQPGYMNPEGIVVWHEAARHLFKVTLENDEKPKGSTE